MKNSFSIYVTTLYLVERGELLSHFTGVACSQRNLLMQAVVDPMTDSDNRYPKMPEACLPYYYA